MTEDTFDLNKPYVKKITILSSYPIYLPIQELILNNIINMDEINITIKYNIHNKLVLNEMIYCVTMNGFQHVIENHYPNCKRCKIFTGISKNAPLFYNKHKHTINKWIINYIHYTDIGPLLQTANAIFMSMNYYKLTITTLLENRVIQLY